MAAPWLRVEPETDAAHAPVRSHLMARAGLLPGQRVLDIGPGAGVSLLDAAAAVGPTGHVTGIEIAPPFAERARERVPGHVDVIVADAQSYEFAPPAYDAAISLFGVMFFEDSVAGLANIRSAMKPGAMLDFACWGPPQHNPWFTAPGQVAETVFGPGESFGIEEPGPMRFSDVDGLKAVLRDAGWTPEIETRDLHLTPLGGPEDVARLHMSIGAAAMRMRLAKEAGTLTDAQREQVRKGLTEFFEGMVVDGAVQVPARIHFARATA